MGWAVAAPFIASAAGQAAGGLFGSLFGGGKGGGSMPVSYNVNSPSYGLSASLNPQTGSFSTNLFEKNTAEVANRIARTGRIFGDLDSLRGDLKPGFGLITQARVNAIRNAAGSAESSLRDELARRRLSGSSFGSDAIARQTAEFAQAEAGQRGQSILEEISVNQALLDQENTMLQQQVQKGLAEMGLAVGYSTSLNSAMSTQNSVDKYLAAQNSAGTGKFFGNIGGTIGQGVGAYFGGGGNAAPATSLDTMARARAYNALYNPDL